ncbi:MAG: hypothetical protein J7D61_14705 [Marichromatium sp.]|nr:hypothetical protein [Marichromatium sp.]
MSPIRPRITTALLAGCVLASASSTAEETHYRASLYLWGAGIEGETARGAELDVGFDTLIRNLDLAFMGALEARRGPWTLIGDVVYLNVSAEDGATLPIGGGPRVDAELGTKGWILDLSGAYRLVERERLQLDLLAGVRRLDLEIDFSSTIPGTRERRASQGAWDLIGGLRGRITLDQRWSLPWRVDLGAGQSDLAWQALGGISYRREALAVSLLYRHLAWSFDDDERLDHIRFSGPVLAASWHF